MVLKIYMKVNDLKRGVQYSEENCLVIVLEYVDSVGGEEDS